MDGEQFKALQDMILKLQDEFNRRLAELEKMNAKAKKEVIKMKNSVKEKADRDAVLDGQQQFFDDLN